MSGISQLSVPERWSKTTLGDIRRDDTTNLDPAKHPDERFALFSIPAHPTRVPELVAGRDIGSAKKTLSPNTVLLSKINPRINRVWIVGEFSGLRQIGSGEWIAFSPIEGIVPLYLAYYLRQDRFRTYLASNVSGVGGSLMRVNASVVNPFPFAFPSSREQQRIVEALDAHLSRLDDAVLSLERVQAKLKAYRASVLKAAVEGRLVPTEAALARAEKRAYESAEALLARILKERRRRWEKAELASLKAAGKSPKDDKWKAKYEEPSAPETSTLPELPEGWCWTSLGALIVDGPQNGIYVPKSQYGDGTPILRIDDYQVDWSRSASELQRVKLAVDDEARFGLSLGDLVLNRVNSPSHLGKTLAVEARHLPAVFESNMMRFTPSGASSSHFLHFYLSSAQGKERLTAGAKWAVNQASINQQDVGNTAVPLPPESEQVRLVAEIDRLLSAAAVAAATVEQNTRRSGRLRQAVLKWAFEGKLVDQDSTGEPAEKLLARIRAERAAVAPTKKNGGRRAKGAA